MSTFYNNYIRLCNNTGKTPSRVALEIGLSKTAVHSWKKRGSVPTDATLKKIADYFDITVDELTGEATLDIAKAADPEASGLSEYDIKALEWFHSLSPENRRAILTVTGGPAELAEAPDRE